MITFELRELARQAKIPNSEVISRYDLLSELEEDYYSAMYDAAIEHYHRGFGSLLDLYFD